MRFVPLLFATSLLVACAAQESGGAPPAAGDSSVSPSRGPSLDLSDWGRETIELPPEFAPDLPAGREKLLFAPGMFEDGEELWSYAFVLRIEEARPDQDRLAELLESYYDGLIVAVAGGKGLKVGDNPAHVRIRSIEDHRYLADVALVDAFVTEEALVLHMRVRTEVAEDGTSILRITASPQDDDHEVWQRLEQALATLEI